MLDRGPRKIKFISLFLGLFFLGGCATNNITRTKLDRQLNEVAKNVLRSTVLILTEKGGGSGAIISKDGYVITAKHLIDEWHMRAKVHLFGKTTPVRMRCVYIDPVHDVSIIKIDQKYVRKYVNIINSKDIKILDPVIFAGNPIGLDWTISTGRINAYRFHEKSIYIQCDFASTHGGSGGGVYNLKGELFGIYVMQVKMKNCTAAMTQFNIVLLTQNFLKDGYTKVDILEIIENDRRKHLFDDVRFPTPNYK